MVRFLPIVPLLLVPTALAAASLPSSPRVPSYYGLSTLAAQARDDSRVCLTERKTGHLVCRTLGEWRKIARRLEARTRSDG